MYQLGIYNPQQADQAMMMLDMMDFRGKDELEQKVSQNGMLQQMCVQYAQIALGLAQQYDPMLAEQLAAQIGQSQNVLSPEMIGNSKELYSKKPQAGETLADGTKSTGNTMVDNARQRAADASRPD